MTYNVLMGTLNPTHSLCKEVMLSSVFVCLLLACLLVSKIAHELLHRFLQKNWWNDGH